MIICKKLDPPDDHLQQRQQQKRQEWLRGLRGSIGSSKTICKNGKHDISILQSDVVEPDQSLVDSDQILAGETSFTPYTCISQPHAD